MKTLLRHVARAVGERAGLVLKGRDRYLHLVRDARALDALVELHRATRGLADADARDHSAFFDFCIEHQHESMSQFFQDLFVLDVLAGLEGGYFVDVGAGDGVTLSNTWALERDHAWNGIAVEPARRWHRRLAGSRRCHIDHRCVWHVSGESVAFLETTDAQLSTIETFAGSDSHADARRGGRSYRVETVSLDDLLVEYAAPARIDYLSLDTEGSEEAILGAFDFRSHDVRVITVEHNHTDARSRIHDLLTRQGYRRMLPAASMCDDWYVAGDPMVDAPASPSGERL